MIATDDHARATRRALLISFRDLERGGDIVRWRSFQRDLPSHGWTLDVLHGPVRPSAVEFSDNASHQRRARARARVMAKLGDLADRPTRLLGVKPAVLPLSTSWILRGTVQARRALRRRAYDVVAATGPPVVAWLVARMAWSPEGPPMVIDLVDPWARNPDWDRGGPIVPALERRVLEKAAAITVTSPEYASEIAEWNPWLTAPVFEISNGFEPDLYALRRRTTPNDKLTILHSGTVRADRPLEAVIEAISAEPWRSAFRLVVQGFVEPTELQRLQESRSRCDLEIRPPTKSEEATRTLATADIFLLTLDGAFDRDRIAAKLYEYLAVGRPILAVTPGGAGEARLRLVGADAFCARPGDVSGIRNALDQIAANPNPLPVPISGLKEFERPVLAKKLAAVLNYVLGTPLPTDAASLFRANVINK